MCGNATEQREVPARRGGYYFVNEVKEPLRSVTTMIGQIIAKPALTEWMKKMVAEAVFADPTISIEEALRAPNKPRDKAGNKGSDIHRIIEAAAQGMEIDPEAYSGEHRQHVNAYLQFCAEMPHKIVAAEQTVWSQEYKYAGTLDAIIELADGRTMLVDYKTNKSVYPLDMAMQLSFYWVALAEKGRTPDGMAIVHLRVDGTYAWHELKPVPAVVAAIVHLYQYLYGTE